MPAKAHQDIPTSEIPWRDGSAAGVKYASYRTDEARQDSPYIVLSKFGAGAVVPPHTHDSNYFEYIIEGE